MLREIIGGALVGLLSAAVAALVFASLIGYGIVADTRALVRAHNDPDRETVAYLVVRRMGATAAAVAAPLIPIYLIAAVATGQLSGILGAFVAGSVAVQAAGGLLVLLVLAVAAWVTRGAVPDLRAALRNLAADTSVRLAVFRRGVPIVAMVTVYFLALGFDLPWFAAGVFALVAGIGTRGVYYLFRRIRYRATELDSPERTPSQVQVRAYRLSTADGERYYASVNAHELAHEDADSLTDAVCCVAGTLLMVTVPARPSSTPSPRTCSGSASSTLMRPNGSSKRRPKRKPKGRCARSTVATLPRSWKSASPDASPSTSGGT